MYRVDELETMVNHNLDIIENNSSDEKAKAKLREAKYQINCLLESYPSEISYRKKMIDELEYDLNNNPKRVKATKEINDEINRSEALLKEQEDKLSRLEILKKELDECFSEKQAFDKAKFIKNIRELMREKDVKIGQIESMAGVRTGYLSRLDRKGIDTLPSIAFLISAAKLLDVTIDELINREPGKLSEDENYINDFLKDLIVDTEKHVIHWNKEPEEVICVEHNFFDNPPKHPLLYVDDLDIRTGDMPSRYRYGSLFYKDSEVYPESAYSVKIGEKNSLYLVQCFTDEKDKAIPQKRFVEIYISDDEGWAKPVCNSIQASNIIVETINKLLKAAINDAAHVYIEPDTKSIIDNYRRKRKKSGTVQAN